MLKGKDVFMVSGIFSILLLVFVLAVPDVSASMPDFVGICAGHLHSIALADDGTVWTWGHNEWGELGDGTLNDRLSPAEVSGLSGIVQVGAGDGNSFALADDGTLWSWGLNSYGQLGDGTTIDRTTPAQADISNVKAVSVGNGGFVIALLNDGTVWEWGRVPGSSVSSTPTRIAGLSGIVAVSAGNDHALALDDQGRVWAWGDNEYGQVGSGSPSEYSSPVIVLDDAKAVATGNGYSLALKNDGSVWAWGDNQFGELGDGTVDDRLTPVSVDGIDNVEIIILNCYVPVSMAICENGTVWAWGLNSGRFGTGTDSTGIYSIGINPSPVLLPLISGSIEISPGQTHVLALRNGSIWAWGFNNYGDIGDGTLVNRVYPVRISGSDSASTDSNDVTPSYPQSRYDPGSAKVVQVFAGVLHSAALMSDGTVFMWGSNSDGQYGDGTATTSYLPVKVPAPDGISSIALGSDFTLYLTGDGTVWACGNNAQGQIGDGTTRNRYKPVRVSGLTGVKEIVAASWTSLALKDDGTVWAWGDNQYGTLGDGTYNDSLLPERVQGLPRIVKIAAGYYQVLALDEEGEVWTWGLKTEYGVGVFDNKGNSYAITTPVKVSISNVSSIAAGATNCLALKDDGTVWAWGDNRYGQLGDGTNVSKAVPVRVAGLTGVVDIASGSDFSMATLDDGQVLAWGNLIDGMSGTDSSNANYLSPVRVKMIEDLSLFSVKSQYILALTLNGSIVAMGSNVAGVLGDGTNVFRQSPVSVHIGLKKDQSESNSSSAPTNSTVASGSASPSLPAPGMDIDTVMIAMATLASLYNFRRPASKK